MEGEGRRLAPDRGRVGRGRRRQRRPPRRMRSAAAAAVQAAAAETDAAAAWLLTHASISACRGARPLPQSSLPSSLQWLLICVT